MEEKEINENIMIYFKDKEESVEMEVTRKKSLLFLKLEIQKKFPEIDIKNNVYDLYIENFHLNSFYDKFEIKLIYEVFNTELLIIEKRKKEFRFKTSEKLLKSGAPEIKISGLSDTKIKLTEITLRNLISEEKEMLKAHKEEYNNISVDLSGLDFLNKADD